MQPPHPPSSGADFLEAPEKILGLEGTLARHARHPNQCSGHLSHCFTPKRHSLLQPGLPHPGLFGGPQHGDKKWGKRGDNWENRGKLWRAR